MATEEKGQNHDPEPLDYDIDTLLKQLLIDNRPIHIKVEKNSKGYNYSVSYYGKDLAECADIVMQATDLLKIKYDK